MFRKPTMDLALLTGRTVVLSYHLKVLQPILPYGPSDHHNYLLQGSAVGREPLKVILLAGEDDEVLEVPETVGRGTSPRLERGTGVVGCLGVSGQNGGLCCVVGLGGSGKAPQEKKRKEKEERWSHLGGVWLNLNIDNSYLLVINNYLDIFRLT